MSEVCNSLFLSGGMALGAQTPGQASLTSRARVTSTPLCRYGEVMPDSVVLCHDGCHADTDPVVNCPGSPLAGEASGFSVLHWDAHSVSSGLPELVPIQVPVSCQQHLDCVPQGGQEFSQFPDELQVGPFWSHSLVPIDRDHEYLASPPSDKGIEVMGTATMHSAREILCAVDGIARHGTAIDGMGRDRHAWFGHCRNACPTHRPWSGLVAIPHPSKTNRAVAVGNALAWRAPMC